MEETELLRWSDVDVGLEQDERDHVSKVRIKHALLDLRLVLAPEEFDQDFDALLGVDGAIILAS